MKCEFSKIIGKIKPMHAINNVPLLDANDEMFHYVGEAGIPFSRLHDTGRGMRHCFFFLGMI